MLDLKYIVDTLSNYMNLKDEDFIAYYLCRRGYNPFEVLVAIVLSQNTRDELAMKAFNNLRSVCGVLTPQVILNKPPEVVKDAVRVAGMYRRRTLIIKELARVLSSLDSIDRLLTMPTEEVRDLLLSIEGIGYKTVDVFLLMCRGEPVFPIDTHIRRVLSRLGIIERGDDYLRIQEKVHKLLPPNYYLKTHLTLIAHGRTYCRARKPLCSVCPINNLCPKKI